MAQETIVFTQGGELPADLLAQAQAHLGQISGSEELKNRLDRKSRTKLITLVTIRIAHAQPKACPIKAWARRGFQKNKRAGP